LSNHQYPLSKFKIHARSIPEICAKSPQNLLGTSLKSALDSVE
jgi:hypothetical protein